MDVIQQTVRGMKAVRIVYVPSISNLHIVMNVKKNAPKVYYGKLNLMVLISS